MTGLAPSCRLGLLFTYDARSEDDAGGSEMSFIFTKAQVCVGRHPPPQLEMIVYVTDVVVLQSQVFMTAPSYLHFILS